MGTTKTGARKPLGRGLGNLLENTPEAKVARQKEGIVDIPIEKIKANPDNPRKKFDKSAIDELAQTIEKHGLLQPILVQKEGDGYLVISGERRLRACRQLKLKTIPCIVKEYDRQTTLEVSLIENIQREQLDPIEEAMVYRNLLESFGMTQEELSAKVGKNRATIANRIRLLQLPDALQTALADGRLTEGQLRPLLSLKSEVLQLKLLREIEKESLNARQIEELVRRYKREPSTPKKKSARGNAVINAEARQLEEVLGVRVKIVHNEKSHNGKIVIEYFNLDDFERLKKKLIGH